MQERWRAIALVCLLLAMGRAHAATPPLPRVPTMVTELYLPAEQAACRSGYAIYASLGDELRAKLHNGTKYPIASAKLSEAKRSDFAAWFNSARWGCEPPAEKLDAAAVAKSALLLAHEDGIVELALCSPGKGIWKKLTIACTPEKAEWVRDGLPLPPAWFEEPWGGGTRPPAPARTPPFDLAYHDWVMVRNQYCVYAGLPADSLRKLHRSYVLEVRFADLPPVTQRALAESCHEMRFIAHSWGVLDDSFAHPEWLQKRLYGITRVKLFYARRAGTGTQLPFDGHGPGLATFPRPYRVVSIAYDGLKIPDGWWKAHGGSFDSPPPSEWVRTPLPGEGPGGLIAWPPEMQRKALARRHEYQEWYDTWMEKVPGGAMGRPGAPRPPSCPWTQDST